MSHDTVLIVIMLIFVLAAALFIKDFAMLHVSIRASIRAASKMNEVVWGDDESFDDHLKRVPDLTDSTR